MTTFRLKRARKVAIVGVPMGKSTLVNTLIGEERVIAFDMPGNSPVMRSRSPSSAAMGAITPWIDIAGSCARQGLRGGGREILL